MAQTAAGLVEHVTPHVPVRQWVLSLPIPLRLLLAAYPKLKTPWRDGTTHLAMSPLKFMQRLAALVPRPRLHLTRFHGVLAPNAKLRAMVVPQEPQAPAQEAIPAECEANCAHHRPVRLSWAKLLKRVFEIDIASWLQARCQRLGMALLGTDDTLRVEGYEQHRGKGGTLRVCSVDFSGRLRVVDPAAMQQALFSGIGHAKAFGCGLLLVRPTGQAEGKSSAKHPRGPTCTP